VTGPLPGWAVTSPARNSTLATMKVPLTAGRPYKFTVAARMTFNLQAGTVLLFWSKVQGAVIMDHGAMFAGYVQYQFSDPSGAAPAVTNRQVTTAQGVNIRDRTDHYGIDHHLAVLVVPDTGRYTFEHVIYAATTIYDGDPADYVALRYCDQEALVLTPAVDPRWAQLAEQVSALQDAVAALQADPPAPAS
jgi:hypothetical protein